VVVVTSWWRNRGGDDILAKTLKQRFIKISVDNARAHLRGIARGFNIKTLFENYRARVNIT